MYTPTSLTPLLFVTLGVQLKHHMTPSPILEAWYSSYLVYNIICMYALSSTAKENINCRLPTADILVVPLATVFACSQFCGSATVADGRI
jgi:hypothetical protein